jgi:hypothetical protein
MTRTGVLALVDVLTRQRLIDEIAAIREFVDSGQNDRAADHLRELELAVTTKPIDIDPQ